MRHIKILLIPILVFWGPNSANTQNVLGGISEDSLMSCTFGFENSIDDWSLDESRSREIESTIEYLNDNSNISGIAVFKAYCLTKLKKLSEAKTILGEVLDSDQFNPEALKLRGRIAIFEADYMLAKERLAALIEVNPLDFDSYYFLSIANQELGHIGEALEIIERSINIAKEFYPLPEPGLRELKLDEETLYLRYSDLLQFRGDRSRAIQVLEEAFGRNSASVRIFDELYRLYSLDQNSDELKNLELLHCDFLPSSNCPGSQG